MNKEKYGSIEYHLTESIDQIQKSIEKIKKTYIDQLAIKKINSIVISLPYSFENICNWSHYSSFQKTNKDHIEKVYQATLSYIKEKYDFIEKQHAENIPIIEFNKKVYENVVNFMTLTGMPSGYSTFAYKNSRSRTKTETKELAGYLKDLNRWCQTTDGYEQAKFQIASFKERLEKWHKDHLSEIQKTYQEKQKNDVYIRKVALSLEIAKKHNLTYKDNDDLINQAEEIYREKWCNENYPDGTHIDQSCCENCSSWKIGERRCSCGNRRMYLDIQGNMIDGYYAYAQAD
jgi:hypothetical protein